VTGRLLTGGLTMRVREGSPSCVLAVSMAGCGRPGRASGVATARSGAAASGTSTLALGDQGKAPKFGRSSRDNALPRRHAYTSAFQCGQAQAAGGARRPMTA
jgi:hypothetical protein